MFSRQEEIIYPKISVVITTYNRCNLVTKAIESVVGQTYKNIELHIVDDGSSDGTRNIIEAFLKHHKNICYWKHEKNKGLAAARNTGISKSKAAYIAFLDDDDHWMPKLLEKQINLLGNLTAGQLKTLGVIYCGCKVHIPHEARITAINPKIMGSIRTYILSHNLSTIPSANLFPTSVLKHLGGFDEGLSSSIDHDIWMKLAVHGYHAYFVNEPLVITYNLRHHKSMVNDTVQRVEGVRQYVVKWMPTYKAWFGEKKGRHYGEKYFMRVMASLAATKLTEGKIQEGVKIIKEIYRFSGNSLHNTTYILFKVIKHIVRKILPSPIIDRLTFKNSNLL